MFGFEFGAFETQLKNKLSFMTFYCIEKYVHILKLSENSIYRDKTLVVFTNLILLKK